MALHVAPHWRNLCDMTTSGKAETYIGDGVTAVDEGFQIMLNAGYPRVVYLGPGELSALVRFANSLGWDVGR